MLIYSNKFERNNIISMMGTRWKMAMLLLACVAVAQCEEWYQQGHQDQLTWPNFDSAVQQQGKFKFVKFFTRNCRYCRMLKQVEEQLREEKQWSFEFYSVDCSIHYDLCVSKASMSAFPYVGIYNTQGKLHGTIGGYYPLDTMREAFTTIEAWQKAELQTPPQAPIAPTSENKQEIAKTTEPKSFKEEAKLKEVEKPDKTQTVADGEVKDSSHHSKKQIDEDESGWSDSVREGIKMTIILLGVIIFNKTISPYLQPEADCDDYSKPRIIEIPVQKQSSMELAKEDSSECNKLLNDRL